jgi:ubiquinone/menaquinone biosynthesis C-methylase UbiE
MYVFRTVGAYKMTMGKALSDHYIHGNLLQAIKTSIAKLGITLDSVTIDDLAPVDEFHVGGREATENLLQQLNFPAKSHILDVGCGLGGAARYVAQNYNSHVTGIDITKEFVETGKSLCSWVKLEKQVALKQGSVTDLPFQDEHFDGGYMLHVGMNIEDKDQLFREIFRVLRQGSKFGVYDIMRISDGDIDFPVPWATEESASKLSTPEQYQQALIKAGFDISQQNNRSEYALDYFKRLSEKTAANGGPPPLGLHTLMKDSGMVKINNMVKKIAVGYIAPVEITLCKN